MFDLPKTELFFKAHLRDYRHASYAHADNPDRDLVPVSGKLRPDGTLLCADAFEHVSVPVSKLRRWSYRADKWVRVRKRDFDLIDESNWRKYI